MSAVVDPAVGAARDALASGLQWAFTTAAAATVLAVVGSLLVRDVPLYPARAGATIGHERSSTG